VCVLAYHLLVTLASALGARAQAAFVRDRVRVPRVFWRGALTGWLSAAVCRRPMALGALREPVPLPLLGIISPLTSILLRASDESAIARQLLALQPGGVLACCAFPSSAPATCWLTDPTAIDVVTDGSQCTPAGAVVGGSAGWMAVISHGSRSCFEIDRSGVGGVMRQLRSVTSMPCVVALFAAGPDAYLWLAGDSAASMLELLVATAHSTSSAAGLPGRRLLPPPSSCPQTPKVKSVPPRTSPPVRGTGAPLFVSVPMDKCVVPAVASSCETRGGASSSRAGPGQLGCFVGSCAASGASPRRGATGKRRTPSVSTCRSASAPAPSPAMSGRGGFWAGPLGASPPPSSGRGVGHGARRGRAWNGSEGSNPPSPKRRRLDEAGGPSAALNPAGVGQDGMDGLFSFSGIHESVKDSVAAWEDDDVEEALRRDAALCARRQVVPTDDCDSSRCSTIMVATRAPAGVCSVPVLDTTAGNGGGALVARGGSNAVAADATADAAPPPQGSLTHMAANQSWTLVFARLFQNGVSTFISGGPGVGKSTFLCCFTSFLRSRLPQPGAVVVVAPTGSAAKTAEGVTFHSFFGFPKNYKMQGADPVHEAAHLLGQDRWKPIARRLAKVEVLLLDEISMVAADKLDVMYELLRQSRRQGSPSFVVYTFGDFLQLKPTIGALAFTARCWRPLFGDGMLELTRVHRQGQPDFVQAIRDARLGRCTDFVQKLMDECSVDDEAYKALECTVLHLMPRHNDVIAHNAKCLLRLCPGDRPQDFVAVDSVKADPNRDRSLRDPDVHNVSPYSRDAALLDCIAPLRVQHCRGARVMLVCNNLLAIGLFHGSIGNVRDYDCDGSPVVRFENHQVVAGTRVGTHGVRDAGVDWIEVVCPPVDFEARIFSCPGALAVRRQVPFVLGWAITVHRSQSLTLTEAVLDVGEAFGAGMVLAAMSRVSDKRRMHVRSFSGSRLLADPEALRFYRVSIRW